MTVRMRRDMLATIAVLALFAAYAAAPVDAAHAESTAGWEATTHTWPTNLPPGGTGLIFVDVFNVGAANAEGVVTVTDVLPPGVVATDAGTLNFGKVSHEPQYWDCTGTTVVTCTSDPGTLSNFPGGAGVPAAFAPQTPQIAIAVKIASQPSGTLTNEVTIAGGGAKASATSTGAIRVNPTPAGFGIANWDGWFSNEDGTIDTQAGSHPYAATFDFEINSEAVSEGNFAPAGDEIRNVTVDLPAGLVGNPTAVSQCPRALYDENAGGTNCPPDSVVGVESGSFGGRFWATVPVYNLVPPAGVPRRSRESRLAIMCIGCAR